MTSRVVLDSDFCQILLSKHNQDEAKAFFKSIFKCLKISPILHEYVYIEVKNVEQVFQDIDTTKHNDVDLKERKRILKFIKNKR